MNELIAKAEQTANLLASDLQQAYKVIATRVARDVTSNAAEAYMLELLADVRRIEAKLASLGVQ